MRSATGCTLSPANMTHLYLLYLTEKTIKRQPGGVSIQTGFTPLSRNELTVHPTQLPLTEKQQINTKDISDRLTMQTNNKHAGVVHTTDPTPKQSERWMYSDRKVALAQGGPILI